MKKMAKGNPFAIFTFFFKKSIMTQSSSIFSFSPRA